MYIKKVCYFKCVLLFLFYDLEILVPSFIAILFCLYLYSPFFKRGMEGRWNQGRETSRGRGPNRGRGVRQVQESKEERDATAEQQLEPRVEGGDQVATAIQQMTNILARLEE